MSSTELMKQALHCGSLFDPDVEPDRRVEGHLLVDEEVRQLGLERLEIGVRGEVALGLRPGRDRVDDAIDELADRGLALGRVEVAAEVLADHDVGRELAPEVGDLDVLLLEDALARLVGDAGGPVLPGDLVVGMDVRAGPAALEGQAASALAGEAGTVRACEAGRGGGGLVGGLGRLLGLRAAVMGCDRCPVPSSHLLSPRRLRCTVRGSCRIALASLSPNGPGGRSGTGGWGRRGTCWASRWDQSTPRTIRRVVVDVNPKTTRCSGCSSVPGATCGGLGHPRSDRVRPRSGGVRPHARRRCPPVRAPVDMGCPRVVHRLGDGTSVLIAWRSR